MSACMSVCISVCMSAEQYMASSGRRNPQAVLIISYETFRLHATILHRGTVGLVICDEVVFYCYCNCCC